MKQTIYIIGLCLSLSVQAQVYDYNQLLGAAALNNSSYLAQKYNVDIAMAEEQAARVFNNPEISFTYGNNQDWNLHMGQTYEAGLSYSIPLSSVRGDRIRVASANRQANEAEVADFWCDLKLQISHAYAAAWLAKQQMQLCYDNYRMMEQIARADSIRLTIGDVSPTDAMQSFLEVRTARAEWLMAGNEYHNALLNLSVFIGGTQVDSIGELPELPDAVAALPELQQQACDNRNDLKAAYWQQNASEKALQLVRAQQAPDLTINAGYVHSKEVRNEIAPAPKYDGFSVGVSMPLNFSSLNRGERSAAENRLKQSSLTYQTVQQQINAEVAQTYHTYLVAEEISNNYDASILSDAQLIQQKRHQAYTQGDTGLLPLLDASRTYRDILSSYYEAIANRFVAYSELMRATGQ